MPPYSQPIESESQSAKFRSRVKAVSAFQSVFKQASAEEHKNLTEQELAKIRAIILKTRGFSSLNPQHLEAMIQAGQRKVYDKDELLILQNDCDVGYFFVLLEGSLKFVVRSESEEPKSGIINCTDHGNVVGHFGSLYQRPRDSSVYSTAGAVAWRFSFEGVPGLLPPSQNRLILNTQRAQLLMNDPPF